jgi:hypothetical protein
VTHLILVLGIISSLALATLSCLVLFKDVTKLLSNPMCMVSVVLSICGIIPVCFYLMRVVGQYDDRLMNKQQQALEKKQNLTRSYNELLSDMDALLTKSAESSAGLAERSFESKRRDFQRFLERAKMRFSRDGNYSGQYHKGEAEQLLKQFRCFCINWLKIFEECSIDPIHFPKQVVTQEELLRCTTITEVCDLCLERLRVTEVRFITVQRDEDMKLLKKNQNELRRITTAAAKVSGQQSGGAGPLAIQDLANSMPAGPNCCSWWKCGLFGCGVSTEDAIAEEGFPKECSCLCMRVVLLSKEHVVLLFGCVSTAIVITMSVYTLQLSDGSQTEETPVLRLCLAAMALVAIIVMLVRFEEIDVIQQMEREVKQLEQSTAAVEQQRQRMREFWTNCQQLTELWLYRTVPRLDLYKELHSQIEDVSTENALQSITSSNQHLEELNHHLGPLEYWRNDGQVTLDDKKAFSKAVNQICQEQELPTILKKLEDVTKSTAGGNMKSLQNKGLR